MHVLMTSDTVGGVWTYTQEVVRGLVSRGNRVTLISMGEVPRPAQMAWTGELAGLDYRPTSYRLEWMQNAEEDIQGSRAYIESVIHEVKPDILHLNQYCYGDIACDVPRIVVAHSDVVSWWSAVHGCEPEPTSWMTRYRETVQRGLRGAEVVVAPSAWMKAAILQHYDFEVPCRVIHNGRSPHLFESDLPKENFVLSVGRIWDEGKQLKLLTGREHHIQVCIAGREKEPGASSDQDAALQFCGEQSQDELRGLYARAPIYVATSRYEPFGLAPLEAAFSRCALIANDIPVFRELWGDAAYYFRRDDAEDLAEAIRILHKEPKLRKLHGDLAYARARNKFTADVMVNHYLKLYETAILRENVA